VTQRIYSPNGARSHASELLAQNPNILERRDQLLALRADVRVSAVSELYSLDLHLAKLAELRDEAQSAGMFDAAISAEHKRGLALGYYVQRSETGKPGDFTSGMSKEQIDAEIAKLVAEMAIEQGKNGAVENATHPHPTPSTETQPG
jgi:hypothetical protein